MNWTYFPHFIIEKYINSKPYSFQRTLITSTSWQAWSTVLNFEILSNSHSKYGGAWFTNIISFDVTGELCGFQARMLLSWFLGWSFLDVCGVKIVEKCKSSFFFAFLALVSHLTRMATWINFLTVYFESKSKHIVGYLDIW